MENIDLIHRQAELFKQTEQYVLNNFQEQFDAYGFSYEIRYQVIQSIYKEVNADIREPGARISTDLLYRVGNKIIKRKANKHGKS